MAKEINLLPEEQGPDRVDQISMWSVRIAGVLVCLFIVVTIGILIGTIFVSRDASALDAQITKAKQVIQSKQEEEELYNALSNKIQFISSTADSRFPYYTFVSMLRQLSGDEVRVNDIVFSGKSTMSLTVFALSSTNLDSFIKKVVGSSIAKTYVVELTSTSRNDDGSYTFDMQFAKPTPSPEGNLSEATASGKAEKP